MWCVLSLSLLLVISKCFHSNVLIITFRMSKFGDLAKNVQTSFLGATFFATCHTQTFFYFYLLPPCAKEVMFLVALVRLSVCLSVCLWTTLLKKL